MRIPSGVTDQFIYFVAKDASDLSTRETGLSSFTVYRSRNGAAAAAMDTPTINETDSTNMPGVYELLLDEDMTIGAGNDSEEMVFHITHSGMAPVDRTIELYRKISDVVWDELLTGGTHNIQNSAGKRLRQIQENLGYDNGSVWIDTVNGNDGTENFENGTTGNKSKNIADARTIADSLNLNIFQISPGSSFTLDQAFDNFALLGEHWTLALDGRSISDTWIAGAVLSGIGTGANKPHIANSEITNVTLPSCHLHSCALEGTLTLADAGDYFLDQCYSAIAGTSTPSVDFQSGVGITNLSMRHYSGGIEIKNMGQTGADNMSLEGEGQLIINSNCDPSNSPVIAIRGNFTITDNVAGGFVAGGGTISQDANYQESVLTAANVIELKASTGWTAGGTSTFAKVMTVISAGIGGNYVDGDSNDFDYLDIDDQSVVISEDVDDSTPYVTRTIA